jgi:Holliday junction resolvase RusA-like endonuclease
MWEMVKGELVYQYTLSGKPTAWTRPRANSRGKRVTIFNSKGLEKFYKGATVLLALGARGMRVPLDLDPDGVAIPLIVEVDGFWQRPSSMSIKAWGEGPIMKTTRPDGDNLAKAALDALQYAGVIDDDARFVSQTGRTWYTAARPKGAPRTVIRIWRARLINTVDHETPKDGKGAQSL